VSILPSSFSACGACVPPMASAQTSDSPSTHTEGCLLPKTNYHKDVRRRYLAYMPQGGLGNQLQELQHAVGWALALNRWLVLPHLLPHASTNESRQHPVMIAGQRAFIAADELVPFSALFTPPIRHSMAASAADQTSANSLLETIQISHLLKLQVRPSFEIVLPATTRVLNASSTYLNAIGWGRAVARHIASPRNTSKWSESDMRLAFGACNDPLLLFRSVLASCERSIFRGISGTVSRLIMPRPHLELEATATIAQLNVAQNASFGCLQVRRGDFLRYCPLLLERLKREPVGVQAGECLQTEAGLFASLESAEAAYGAQITWLSITDDPTWLLQRRALVNRFHLTIPALLRGQSKNSTVGRHREMNSPSVIRELEDVLVDQLVCSRAQQHVLNRYSSLHRTLRLHRSAHALQQRRLSSRWRAGLARQAAAVASAHAAAGNNTWVFAKEVFDPDVSKTTKAAFDPFVRFIFFVGVEGVRFCVKK
jgi:hypothetical protein